MKNYPEVSSCCGVSAGDRIEPDRSELKYDLVAYKQYLSRLVQDFNDVVSNYRSDSKGLNTAIKKLRQSAGVVSSASYDLGRR